MLYSEAIWKDPEDKFDCGKLRSMYLLQSLSRYHKQLWWRMFFKSVGLNACGHVVWCKQKFCSWTDIKDVKFIQSSWELLYYKTYQNIPKNTGKRTTTIQKIDEWHSCIFECSHQWWLHILSYIEICYYVIHLSKTVHVIFLIKWCFAT